MYISKKDLFSLDLSLLSQQAAVPWLKKHFNVCSKVFQNCFIIVSANSFTSR